MNPLAYPCDSPTIDVVVPLYNSARWVARVAESVISQVGVEWSLTFVNDGSPDASGEIAERIAQTDARIRVVQQANRGVCAARNAGARPGRHRYLLFLDADDELLPRGLARLGRRAEATGAVAVFGGVVGIDEDGRRISLPRWQPPMQASRLWLAPVSGDSVPPEAFLIGTAALPAATLIRRDAFVGVGAWDEDLGQYHEDAHLMGRLAIAGRVEHLPEPVAAYRVHSAQVSDNLLLEGVQRQAFVEKWRDGAPAQQEVAKVFYRRVVTRDGLTAARYHFRRRQYRSALRFAAGAVRAYRPWL